MQIFTPFWGKQRGWLMALGGLLLVACGKPPQLSGDALAQRRADTRKLAATLLTQSDKALLGREDLVIRDEHLLNPALDRIMANVQTWMGGDETTLRTFLESEVVSAYNALITSPEGISVLNQQAQTAFARPKVTQSEGGTPGRPASELEKKVAAAAGTVLSGRPAQARDLPTEHWIEVRADFGLVPAPLEMNPRNKQSVSLLRHRRETAGDWLDEEHPERPRLAVVERAAAELLRQHPRATRVRMTMHVLRSLGAPVTWEFLVQRAGMEGEMHLTGTGTATGYREDFGTHALPSAAAP